MRDFSNRRVYITGGSSGIGLETAKIFSGLGAHIVIFARDKEKLNKAKQAIEGQKRINSQMIQSMQLDASDNNDVQLKMKAVVEEFGAPDILIANAGVPCTRYFEDISYELFDSTMKVNVYGVRNVIAALFPVMKNRGSQIAIVSSAAGIMGLFGYTAYGASKYALVGFAENLRSEMRRYDIAITLVCPPDVDTPMLTLEEKTMPPETAAIANIGGKLKPFPVAKAIVSGIARRKFLVIPGIVTRYVFFNHRLTNGWSTRFLTDLVAGLARRKI